MTPLQIWLLKIGLALTVIAGACGATWFAADAHYSKITAKLEQANKDAAVEAAETLKRYAQASMEVNDEAKSKLADATADINDLRVRVSDGYAAIGVCSANGAGRIDVTVGSGSAVGDRQPGSTDSGAGQAIPAEALATIDPVVLRDALITAKDALNAELLWRKYARATGQTTK